MEDEIRDFIIRSSHFKDLKDQVNLAPIMAQITIFTASRSLQDREVREKLYTTFADLYHDLDDGFQPINFMLSWFPLPQNRRRDIAQRKMTQIYIDIIKERRSKSEVKDSEGMLWNLIRSIYKDKTPVSKIEIAHITIDLLMVEKLILRHQLVDYTSSRSTTGDDKKALSKEVMCPKRRRTYNNIHKLPLVMNVIRKTLRIHPPIHSIMRKVNNPLSIEDTKWVIPPSHVLLAAPATIGKTEE